MDRVDHQGPGRPTVGLDCVLRALGDLGRALSKLVGSSVCALADPSVACEGWMGGVRPETREEAGAGSGWERIAMDQGRGCGFGEEGMDS